MVKIGKATQAAANGSSVSTVIGGPTLIFPGFPWVQRVSLETAVVDYRMPFINTVLSKIQLIYE